MCRTHRTITEGAAVLTAACLQIEGAVSSRSKVPRRCRENPRGRVQGHRAAACTRCPQGESRAGIGAGEKGRRIRELTSVVQKRFKFPDGTVELYAEKARAASSSAALQCSVRPVKIQSLTSCMSQSGASLVAVTAAMAAVHLQRQQCYQ